MTLGALLVGVAAVTFAIGLDSSLVRVMHALDRDASSPVRADLREARGSSVSPADVTAAIQTSAKTSRFVSIGESQVTVPRVGSIPFVGYANDSSWLGYALIEGRWSTAPGEAVAPTNFFVQAGLHVGDSVTITREGRSVTIRLVGEIFDTARENDDNLVIRGSWDDLVALQPDVQPSAWEMQPADGVDPRSYLAGLHERLPGVPVYLVGDSDSDASFVLFLTVVGLLGAVLVTISVGGVFNTVLLETRQRTHELAVLKGIGLTPLQVIGMVLSSIVPVGVLAGLLGVPLGLVAQRTVLSYMGQVAAKTAIPPVVFDVFPPALLSALLLAGLAIGALGAWLPAQRAAYGRIAPVLQAE
jgi:putative ABC transport system permease protein